MGNFFAKINPKYVYLAGISILVIFAMKYIVPMFLPFLVAGLIVIPLYPLLVKIEKKFHIKKSVFTAGLLLFVMLLLLVGLWQVVAWVCSYGGDLVSQMDSFENMFCIFVRDCSQMAENRLGINADQMEHLVLDQVTIFIENLQVNIIPKLMNESLTYVKLIGAMIAFLFLTFIRAVLLAKDYEAMKNSLRGTECYRLAADVYHKMITGILQFLRAQLVILMIIASICMLGLLIAGIDSAIALGILIGFMDMLPFIGTGIILLPIAFWQLLEGEITKAIICVLIYVVCVVAREFLEPKLIGEKMGIFPLYILISIYAGLKIYGLAGVIFGSLTFLFIKEIYQESQLP